jgi:lipopolysaccharide export system protein LptC
MHKRTAHRWQLAAILGAATVFALGSFWLVQIMQGNEADMLAAARRNEPDYIIEKFSSVRMSEAGTPHYIFSGAKLTHRPVDDVSEVEQPQLNAINPGQPVMTISARHAHIEHAEKKVLMSGDVTLLRPQAPGVQYMKMSTQALTILPDEDRMETDLAVDLVLGSSTAHGVGMQANNATRQLHVERDGQLVIPPKAAEAR